MAKIAVKMSNMRVVKFMSSWDNDFTSWPKHHQLLFGGQSSGASTKPTLVFPGCHQVATRGFQCEKSEVKNSQSFDVWRTLTPTGVKGCRNRGHLQKSGHETPGSSDAMHTPDVIQQILSEIANWNLKNVKFCGMDEGVLPPMTPGNPYLGGNARKKWATFLPVCSFMHTLETSFWS